MSSEPRNIPIKLLRRHWFWLLSGFSLACYAVLSLWFPLVPQFNRAPLADIRTFTPSIWAGLAYGVWLCLCFALYGMAYRRVWSMKQPPPLALILIAAAFFGMPLLRTFPVNATDVYRYVIRGRVSSAYGQNPYLVPPAHIPEDPFVPLAGEWADETSPYGPLWELTARAVTGFSKLDLHLGLTSFKILGLATHLAMAWLIWQLQAKRTPGHRAAATLLWAWNPALLLTFVADAHNDGLMLFWLVFGLWIIQLGRPTAGFMIMLLSPLTKPIGLLPLPFFYLHIWMHLPDIRARGRFLVLSTVGGLSLATLAFLPFGSPLDLAQRLLREASSGSGFSIDTLILLIARNLGSDLPMKTVSQLALGLFGLAVLWLLWRTWRGRDPVRTAADVFVAYILQALNFRIWYTVWPFPWLLLDGEESQSSSFRLRAGIWLLLTAQLSVLIYGHLRVYAIGGGHFPAHIIGVPFTFLLPFLLARWSRRFTSEVTTQ